MNPQLEKLISLQEIDLEISVLKKLQELIPKQIESGQADLEGKKKDLNELKALIDSLQKKRNQFEQDVNAESDHLAKTKTKLPAVKTNKEYSALLSEIDAVKQKISDWENQELEVMEELELQEAKIPGLQENFKKEEEEFSAYKSKKEGELERTKKDMEIERARRKENFDSIETKWAKLYEKIIKMRGDKAVVALIGDNCQGCHHKVLPQQGIEVRGSENIETCHHCSRILYAAAEPKTEDVAPK